MKITVLLPVHNDESFIERTLLSLMSQSHRNFVCLIGFNGTIDSSKTITENLVKNDERFILFDFKDEKGKSLTLNKLLDKVETDRFCLIDADDLWHPDKLEKQISVCSEYDVIGTLAYYIDEQDKIFHRLILDQNNESIKSEFLKGHNQIVNSSCMVKTENAKSIGGWDYRVDGLEDFDFWVKLYKNGDSFHNIQDFLVSHRIHNNSNFNAKKLPYSVSDILVRNGI